MFFMHLEINPSGLRQEPVLQNQWEDSDESDEFDSEYNIKIEEIEDARTIFFLICEELESSNLVRFQVEGFGELPWPVDISTDFLTVFEQLLELLKFLNDPESITGHLDFYEQGIQRRLSFSKIDSNLIKINCHGGKQGDLWGQDIEEEPIEKNALKSMICNLIKTFVLIANDSCPTLTNHRYFQEWCSRHLQKLGIISV